MHRSFISDVRHSIGPTSDAFRRKCSEGKLTSLPRIHEWYKSNLWDIMRSKWSLRGFEPRFFHFWRKNMILMEKKQDLNPRSSSLKLSAKPTELLSLVTDHSNILLYWLIHHQTKHLKSNKYIIYHEICIYAKSAHPNSVFCLNL